MDDRGLMFLATISKADGSQLHRETPNRFEFLEWLDLHRDVGDELTITLEATGPAVSNMLAGLRCGAEVLRRRQTS